VAKTNTISHQKGRWWWSKKNKNKIKMKMKIKIKKREKKINNKSVRG